MKTVIRIVLTFISFVASNFFLYWMIFSSIDMAIGGNTRIISHLFSLLAAAGIAFTVCNSIIEAVWRS